MYRSSIIKRRIATSLIQQARADTVNAKQMNIHHHAFINKIETQQRANSNYSQGAIRSSLSITEHPSHRGCWHIIHASWSLYM